MSAGGGKRGGFAKKKLNLIQNLFKKTKKEVEIIEVINELRVAATIDANSKASINRLHLNVVCFFSFICEHQPNKVNISRIVNVGKELSKTTSTFLLSDFNIYQFHSENFAYEIKKCTVSTKLEKSLYKSYHSTTKLCKN